MTKLQIQLQDVPTLLIEEVAAGTIDYKQSSVALAPHIGKAFLVLQGKEQYFLSVTPLAEIERAVSLSIHGSKDPRTWSPKIVVAENGIYAIFEIDEDRKLTGTVNALRGSQALQIDETEEALAAPMIQETPIMPLKIIQPPQVHESVSVIEGRDFTVEVKTITTVTYR